MSQPGQPIPVRAEQLSQPVGSCRAGSARVLIARLMLEPAMCCCSMSRPTIWTSRRWRFSKRAARVLRRAGAGDARPVYAGPGFHRRAGLDGRGHAQRFADYSQWEAWLSLSTRENRRPNGPAATRGPGHEAPSLPIWSNASLTGSRLASPRPSRPSKPRAAR